MIITKQIGIFKAKSDAGETYTVTEFQEYISVLTNIGNNNEFEGIKRWKTSTGSEVKQIDSNTYRIVPSNEIIRKVQI
jgi:hypothetical protein